jgi:hypothetical protein
MLLLCMLQVGAVPANIKWVDDSHALIVCSSQEAAQVLMDVRQNSFKLRPYHQASDASQVRGTGQRRHAAFVHARNLAYDAASQRLPRVQLTTASLAQRLCQY